MALALALLLPAPALASPWSLSRAPAPTGKDAPEVDSPSPAGAEDPPTPATETGADDRPPGAAPGTPAARPDSAPAPSGPMRASEELESAPEASDAAAPDPAASPAGAEEARAPTPAATPPGDRPEDLPEVVDLADTLAPVTAALERLRDAGARLMRRERYEDALRGQLLQARVADLPMDLAVYVLGRVAADGYQILLSPAPQDTWVLRAWPTRGGQRSGLLLTNLAGVRVTGSFLRGENPRQLAAHLGLLARTTVLDPQAIQDELHMLSYRVHFEPTAEGVLLLQVQPGRLLRRVRVRGEIPLSERRVRRALSLRARPGAMAPGVCFEPKELRKEPRPSMCPDDDLACKAWQRDELQRLRRFMFDQGFMAGKAELALACGRAPDEADLWVLLDPGPAHRVRRRNVRVTGNVGSRDARWIRRLFQPTVSPFLPVPKRVTRKHIEDAITKVAREFAEPQTRRLGGARGARRDLQYPYPAVRVSTNFESWSPTNPPPSRNLELEVDIQLGQGVETIFLGNTHASDTQLLDQMHIFKRREPPTLAAAARESENLRAYLQGRGHPLAVVEGSMPDFGATGLTRLVFKIDEGPLARLRDVRVEPRGKVPPAVQKRILRTYLAKRELLPRGRFTDMAARADLATLLAAYNEAGYLCARARLDLAFWPEGLDQPGAHASLDLATPARSPGHPDWIEAQLDPKGLAALRRLPRTSVHVRLVVDAGPRALTSGREVVRYLEGPIEAGADLDGAPTRDRGRWGAPRMLRGGPLRRKGDERASGIPLRLSLARDSERHIIRQYHSSGFPVADAAVRFVYRDESGREIKSGRPDRLANPRTGMCERYAKAAVLPLDTEISVYEGRSGSFGGTLIRGNFKTLPYVIRREIDWREGAPYDVRRVERTARHIEGTGTTDGVDIAARPVGCDIGDDDGACKVHHVVTVREAKDIAFRPSFGLGLATLDPLYVFLRLSFPNMFGTGWDLSTEGHWGFNIFRALCDDEDCYSRSASMALGRRRIFATPLTFSATTSVQQRVTPARGRISSALAEIRLTWPINDHWQIYGGYLFQIGNISKDLVQPILGQGSSCGPSGDAPCVIQDRRQAVVPDHTGALQSGVRWQRIDNAFNPHDGFMATLDVMLASPWLGGWDWWAKIDASWQHFVPIPRTDDRVDVRYNLRYGHAIPIPSGPGSETTSIPEIWRYFAGGTQDLGLRGILPQTMLVDLQEIDDAFGFVRLRPRAVGGQIRLLGTLALQVVSIKSLLGGALAHSLFFDTGILTERWRQVRVGRDLRGSVGVNLIKFDVRLLTVALGYAVLIPNAIWPGNVRPTDDPNGRFVFDVGVTF